MTFPLLPRAASETAVQVDRLGWGLLCMSALVLITVFTPMAIFCLKYRRGKLANRTPAHLPTMKIEITWTSVTFLLMMGLFAWGANVYWSIETPPPDAMDINVIGKQWMWKIQHQEGNREINEIHVPVDRAVKLTLASEDVIHSFFVPAFRVKQDVVPGRFLTEWFKPTRIGAYRFYCSEYCGADHSEMRGMIYVMSPVKYSEWLGQGGTRDTLAKSGEHLFRELGCSGCHVNSPTVHAPPLEGLYGKPVPLSDGTFARADDQYIRDYILHPNVQPLAGYPPVMPTFEGRVSEEQLLELVAYIKSLGKESPPSK